MFYTVHIYKKALLYEYKNRPLQLHPWLESVPRVHPPTAGPWRSALPSHGPACMALCVVAPLSPSRADFHAVQEAEAEVVLAEQSQ